MIHAFVLKGLFPNDVSIAITSKKPKFGKIPAHLHSSGSDMKEFVLYISKPTNSDVDSDPSMTRASSTTVV
ncbi:hypothetical protein ABZP36_017362 [Zizania latifolia]